MKKIINNKKYNTETATLLGEDSYSNSRDFSHWTEELYRKRTGEFFLYGEGGPMSRYAKVTGQNEWSGGEEIIPLSVEAARDWAVKHLSVDEYESIFGEVAEDDSKRTVTFSISEEAIELLTRMAGETGKSKSQIIDDLIKEH